METRLGKIREVYFGLGGYLGAQLGLSLDFSGAGWGVSAFEGFWSPSEVECSPNSKWTDDDRDAAFSDLTRNIDKYLNQAKIRKVSDLKNVPVEVTFDGGILKSWRILTEVI